MLYNVILFLDKGGLPIFQKEYIPNDKIRPRIFTGIITAMNKKCSDIIGSPCCYLEFNKLSLSIVTNTKHQISCLLIYAKFCGEEFGKLIATELVESFCSEYADEIAKLKKSEKIGEDEKHFKEFENKISPAIKNSITPILEFLQSQKYINIAMLISSDQLLPHNHRVDAISFVSEYRSLMFQTKQFMSLLSETDNEVIIHLHDTIVMIRKIENASLVVTIDKNANNKKQIFMSVAKHCHIIGHILKLIASLGDYGTDYFQWSVNI
mmetsp:Transcript_14320/g.21629  ORF Transcript_14320/g.21629 Transcript_14320/m.21629 type:complete len:266 (-) Transcript_14320:440-1237(-)